MLERRDIFLGLIIGFVFGWLLIPIAANLEINLRGFAFFLPLIFAVLAALALFVAWVLAKWVPPLFQFAKFAAVGVLNSGIDFGILNILIMVTGTAAGLSFVVFKAASFTVAVVNSYIWNKFWVFRGAEKKSIAAEFFTFLGVSLVGLGVNTGTAHVFVNIIGPIGGIAPKTWANIGALAAVVLTLFWNFFGYKLFVFKKRMESPPGGSYIA